MTKTGRWILYLATFLIGNACIFSIPAASDSTPQVIVVTATRDGGEGASTPTPTFTLELTPALTEAPPTLTAGQELSCVEGPHWAFYAWVAKIAEGETVTVLARAPEEWPDYYYVRKGNGTECWAFGGSSAIVGDTSGLPEREAPPLPEITYTIENRTGLRVTGILIRAKDETAWGANRLSGDLNPGESFSLPLTAGFYDVQATDYRDGNLYKGHDTPIGSDPSTNHTVLDLEVDFYFENNESFDICTFAFRIAGSSEYEMLHTAADGAVHPGERITFHLLAGTYWVEMTRCSGPTLSVVNLYIGPASDGIVLSP
jgi:hypothetical protein